MFWRRVRSPTAQQQQQDRRGRTGPRALHKILLYPITDLQCKKYVGLKRIVSWCTVRCSAMEEWWQRRSRAEFSYPMISFLPSGH